MSKAAFDEYVGKSGAKEALAQAVVGLSRASLKDKSVKPATFLRDFFTPAPKGDATAQLNKADKETVTAYMTSSGSNDLITKALVSLYESSSRPARAADFFRDYFTDAAGGPAAPPAAPPPDPPPSAPVAEKAAEPLATEPPAADAAPPEPPAEAAAPEPPPSAPPPDEPAAPAEGEAAPPPEAPAAEAEAAPPTE